jgi:hypothetical protein
MATMSPDPFFDVLRRRLPGVDVVVLPPEPQTVSGVTDPAAAEVAVRNAQRAVVDALVHWWPAATGDLEPPPEMTVRWSSPGPDHLVRAEAWARHPARGARDASRRVDEAERALREAGWATQRRDPDPPRHLLLRARRGPVRLQVYVWPDPGAYDVLVRHEPVDVGERGASLLARAREARPWLGSGRLRKKPEVDRRARSKTAGSFVKGQEPVLDTA